MSNPGVRTLADHSLKDSGFRVRIEDNIGEAIHFHFGDIRIDLTVNEFLEISRDIADSMNNLLQSKGLDIDKIDPIFLSTIARWLPDLESVQYEEIALSKLQIVTHDRLGIPHIKGLKASRVYKALNGDDKEQKKYKQENLKGQNNIDRINSAMESLKRNGYGSNGEYIILFNNQNLVRDGQHRAACLYSMDPSMSVKVARFYFKNEEYGSSRQPWIEHFFKWDKKRLKSLVRVLRHMVRKIEHTMTRKVRMIKSKIQLKLWR